MSTKNAQVFHSFQKLGQIELSPQIPELPEVEFGDLVELEAQAEEIRRAAGEIRGWTLSTLGQLGKVRQMSREAQDLAAPKLAQANKDLASLLSHEIPAYRRAAWLGLLEHEFSLELNSRAEVEELLNRLVKEGRLVECADGALRAYGKSYDISPDSYFGEPEKAEVRGFLAKLLSRVFQETGKVRESKAQALRAQGSSDLKALLTGKPGKYTVEVPSEKVVQNGKTFWRGGGVLLVKSNEQEIHPVDASGAIEGAIQEAQDFGVFLKVYTLALAWDKPPIVPGLDPERGRKIQLLWHLLKRAIRAKEEAGSVAEVREALADRATVSPKEFFLERQLGTCLAGFQGTWENPDGTPGLTDIFFLVERTEEEGVKRIRIADAPDHLREFFAPCLDKEFVEEGKKFEGVAQPLGAVLQAIYGQTWKASQSAEKTDQIANGK